MDADPSMLVLRAKYALSKRSLVHVTVARARADCAQLVGLARDAAGAGDTQTGVTTGLQLRF